MEYQQSSRQESTTKHPRWRRIRVFNRPESTDSTSPSLTSAIVIVLVLVALVVLGIMIF